MALITGTWLNDNLYDTAENDTVRGLGGDDWIAGGLGDDALFGDDGNDVLTDWRGLDHFDGGEGDDLVLLDSAQHSYAPMSATGADTALGGAGDDMLVMRGVGLAHVLYGGAGGDFFTFQPVSNALAPATLVSTEVRDFSSSEGDRLLIAQTALPRTWKGWAPPGFTASVGEAMPYGGMPGIEVQVWTLSDGGVTLLYADLNGNALVDTLDLRVVLPGAPLLTPMDFGAGMFATINGSAGSDSLVGTPIDDSIVGNGGNDTVDGGEGIDVITTGAGDDLIFGGPGRDQIETGGGIDFVDGGEGDDFFILPYYTSGLVQGFGGPGRDTWAFGVQGGELLVMDFQPGPFGDRLDVNALIFDSLTQNPFDPVVGQLRFVSMAGVTELQWDQYGPASNDPWVAVARLPGVPLEALVPENVVGAMAIDSLHLTRPNVAPGVHYPIPDIAVNEDSVVSVVLPGNTFGDNRPLEELTITAALADGSPLPAWLTFVGGVRTYEGWIPGIGQLSGTPANADVAVLDIRITATDAGGLSASDVFTFTVRNVNDAPTVATTPAPIAALEGTLLDWTLPTGTFIDVDAGDLLFISARQVDAVGPLVLPSWLQFDAASGRLFGMPGFAHAGTVVLRFTANDTGGGMASVDVPLSVTVLALPPVLAQPLPDVFADEDAAFSFVLGSGTFSDDRPLNQLTLTATLADGSPLPAWLTFSGGLGSYDNGAPGLGQFSGTPANADVGALAVRVTAVDAQGLATSDEFVLTVRNTNDAPVAVADAAGTPAGSAVAIDVLSNDSDIDAGQVLQVASVGVPSVGSVAVLAGGRLLYTPQAAWNGSLSFGYTVSDGFGGEASAVVMVNVLPSLAGTDLANTLSGSAVADSVDAKGGNDTVNTLAGNDFVRAGDGNDRVNAGDGADTVLGGSGNDTLFGNAGADVLVGGLGIDLLYAGSSSAADGSADVIVFDTTPAASGNRDSVVGFEANARDVIVLSPAVFSALAGGATAGVDGGEFRSARNVVALDANDHLLFDTRTNVLSYDADGNGPMVPLPIAIFVSLTGTLDPSDFSLVLPPGV